MNPTIRSTAVWLGALLICSMAVIASEPDWGELEEYRHCPATPRKGSWRIEVGQLSVDGVFTSRGGNRGKKGDRVYVKTFECGERIGMAMPAELGGEFVFEKFNGTISPVLLGKVHRLLIHRLNQQRGPIKAIPAELRAKMVGPDWGLMVADDSSVAMLQMLTSNEDRIRELLLEPPKELQPFQNNVYYEKKVPRGETEAIEWYLAPVTQYEMYGMSQFGDQAIHQQFYRWTLPKPE